MFRPTDDLRADHALVASGLATLQAIGQHVRAGGAFPADDTAEALRFLREFLAATHFRKENEVIWPALVMRASETAAAPVGDLMRTQEEATELINCLVVFWEPVGELSKDERHGFAETVDALDSTLSRMRESEEQLFDDCDATVPPDDQIDWGEQFAAIEAERGSRVSWQARLRDLATTWQ